MAEDDTDALIEWYDAIADALRGREPASIAHELPGLVDQLADDEDVDHYVVGVSFSKNHTCLDYAVDRVVYPDVDRTEGSGADGARPDPVVESVKSPASERHRYVHFAHPPDPHFDASALRARLLGAIHRERQAVADDEPPTSTFADLWEQL